MKSSNPRTCLYYASALVLLAGLTCAVLIYTTSGDSSGNVLGYESEGGAVYKIMPEDSKQYSRGLELYGGTANVLADELRRWFEQLWHGKSLAWTVGFISIAISSGMLYAANHLQSNPKSDSNGKNTGDSAAGQG